MAGDGAGGRGSGYVHPARIEGQLMATYSLQFGSTTMYVTRTLDGWRAALPGWGSGATCVSTAVSDTICMWRANGSPALGRYCGPTPEPITWDALIGMARPWEADRLRTLAAENCE